MGNAGVIHYHGTPFHGDVRTRTALAGRHACVSYANREDTALIAETCHSFMVDNGAFTAWKKGIDFDVVGYAEYIETWCRHPGFDWYIIPDVIDGSEDDNRRMQDDWLKFKLPEGVPVWHLHESLGYLEELTTYYGRICLGSSGQYAEIGNSRWWGRMADAMSVCCDEKGRPKAKLHGLRMLDPTIFSAFPFSSADSTNVARNMGIDKAWRGPYAPRSAYVRALVLMDRIESHASATTWNTCDTALHARNLELFG